MSTIASFAQDEDDEGPEGPPQAPVNKYILLLMIAGVAFAWYTFKNARASRLENKNS